MRQCWVSSLFARFPSGVVAWTKAHWNPVDELFILCVIFTIPASQVARVPTSWIFAK